MINTTLPEIILLDTIQAALKFVRDDFKNNASNTTKSYLYKLLNGATLEKYELFKQATQVICGAEDSTRLFEIDLAFNRKRNHVPSAHIMLPSEQAGQGGLGSDEGYGDYIDELAGEFNEDYNEDFNKDKKKVRRAVLSRRKNARYDIVIMSDNMNEVILLYHFITAILIALIPHLHIKGLQNIGFGGRDLEPYSGLAPELHMRAVGLNLEYDTFVPSIFTIELASDFEAKGKPLSPP